MTTKKEADWNETDSLCKRRRPGISVGVALGMAMHGKRKHVLAKSKVGKTIKAVSDVMEDLTDAIGL